jgi:hypothetical protein
MTDKANKKAAFLTRVYHETLSLPHSNLCAKWGKGANSREV